MISLIGFTVVILISGFVPKSFAALNQPGVPEDHVSAIDAQTNDPGVRFRLTKKGIDYISQVMGRIITHELPTLRVPQVESDFSQPLSGHLVLRNIVVDKYKAPQAYFLTLLPPNQIQFSVRNADLALSAEYSTLVHAMIATAQSSGIATVAAQGLNFDIVVALGRDADGKPHFSPVNCAAAADYVNLDYSVNANSLTDSLILTTLKPIMQSNTHSLIQHSVCDQVQVLIDQSLNKKFETISASIPLTIVTPESLFDVFAFETSQEKGELLKNEDFGRLVQLQRGFSVPLQNFSSDYRLVQDITVSRDYIETAHKGQISFMGKTEEPKLKAPIRSLQSTEISSDRMAVVFISESVFNSLFQATFDVSNKLIISPDTGTHFSTFLRTSCPEANPTRTVCFGNIFPAAKRKFPDHIIELAFRPSSAPSLTITEDGHITSMFQGSFEVRGHRNGLDWPKELWIRANLSVNGDVEMRVKDNRLFGRSRMTQFQSKVIYSVFETVESSQFETVARYVASLIETEMNEQLRSGLPIPMLRYGRLVNPSLRTFSGDIMVESDFTLDEERLDKILGRKLLKPWIQQV